MEVHSHGHDTLGVNKEVDKIYNPELKDMLAPPSSQIPAGENFTIAPASEGPISVQEKKDFEQDAPLAATFSFQPPASNSNNVPSYDLPAMLQTSQDEIHQVSYDEAVFDDMVMLENGMVTAASAPGDQESFQDPVIHMEEFQESPIPDIIYPTSVLPEDAIEVSGDGKLGISPVEGNLPTEAPVTVVSEVVVEELPAAPTEVLVEFLPLHGVDALGVQPSSLDVEQPVELTDGYRQLSTPGADVHPLTDVAADPASVGDTLQKNEPDGGSTEITDEDIKAVKGQKVVKKFGRKNFGGEVVNYDPETKWFKVLYDDGDEEDLELWEVKLILASASRTPSSSKKRSHTEGGADESSSKSSKKPKKSGGETTAKKKAKGGAKSTTKSPKTPGTRAKSSKKSSASKKAKITSVGKSTKKALDSAAFKTPENSEVKIGKGKTSTRSSKSAKESSSKKKTTGKKVSRSLNLQSPKTRKKGKSAGPKKTPSKAAKTEDTPKPASGVKRKVEGQETAGSKAKRSKVEESRKGGYATFIGKHVKKDFGGKIYDGEVVKFDKKTQFYKVKYEDGDQEDLEAHELELILVSTEDEKEKPVKTGSLSSLMSEEKKASTLSGKKK